MMISLGNLALPRELVLSFGIEVAGVVALVELSRRVTVGAVDHGAALYRGPL